MDSRLAQANAIMIKHACALPTRYGTNEWMETQARRKKVCKLNRSVRQRILHSLTEGASGLEPQTGGYQAGGTSKRLNMTIIMQHVQTSQAASSNRQFSMNCVGEVVVLPLLPAAGGVGQG
jgi:hypothetical protein